MRKSKHNSNNSNNGDSLSPFKSLSYATLSKLSLPLTLNEYFLPFISNIKDCLLFLERFSDENPSIKKLLDVYNKDKAFSKNSDSLDLDLLAEKADLTKGELRRLIISTMDILGDEEALLLLQVNKKSLISKSIEVALTDPHPDSFEERKALMQYYGFHPTPKNSQVNINIDKSQNTANMTQNQIGLPSFASVISSSEKIASHEIQGLINEEENKFNESNQPSQKLIEASPILIDLSPIQPKVTSGLDGFEDDEMEVVDEEEHNALVGG